MPKLATPVQYEPTLEGLNDIRPLQLADEGKVVIPYPVLCKNPPTKNRPAIGKLARCSQQGALLKGNSTWGDTMLTEGSYVTFLGYLVSIVYSKKVKGIIARFHISTPPCSCVWCDPTGNISFKTVSTTAYIYLPFVGTEIWFKGTGTGLWGGIVGTYGFYK